jgi:hypothetical protein
VALVVTLILLAVITFMAVTFLVVSRSERGSVSTTTDQALARLAADAALEQAKADLIMPIMAQDNPFLVNLMVSTNYVNYDGFFPGVESPTNVNFDYKADRSGLTLAEQRENLANLIFRPRVPVYMRDRRTGNQVFQYYLDINRNGRPEMNGLTVLTNELNLPILSNNVPLEAFVTGDPEWIGGLEFPERRHSGTNRFLYRFAYVVAPVGQTLDLNYMHNAGRLLLPPLNGDGFVRNQGVGTWEMNMGAFLTDLNTNMWFNTAAINNGWGNGYIYDVSDLTRVNRGAGFDDATALLRYRYDWDWRTLWTPGRLISGLAVDAFREDGYDTFGSGANNTVLNAVTPYNTDPDENRANQSWPGSYNTNLFVTPMDLLDPAKTGRGLGAQRSLTDRLNEAGNRVSTYDRYTFHRLLEQLGTESPAEEDKININYQNVVNGRVAPNYQTNFYAWDATNFFTHAANRLLDNAGFTFTVTNIQIWPTNYYTPSVHRALQLAANLYDATTSNTYPTVFRPLFTRSNTVVFISGYEELRQLTGSPNSLVTEISYVDLDDGADRDRIPTSGFSREMVYGVPMVIGAKKGLPNFNEYEAQTTLQVTRKLEFRRTGGTITRTNQMYTLAMASIVGAEVFNSYANRYPHPLRLTIALTMRPWMTNEFGKVIYPFGTLPNIYGRTNTFILDPTDPPQNALMGFTEATSGTRDGSCRMVLSNVFGLMPPSSWHHASQEFIPLTGSFEDNVGLPLPRWYLNMRTHLVFELYDEVLGRIIDFANLSHMEDTVDFASRLQQDTPEDMAGCGRAPFRWLANGSPGSLFCTNRVKGGWASTNYTDIGLPTAGILSQIHVARGSANSVMWDSSLTGTNASAVAFFSGQLLGVNATNQFYAPFSPTREIYLFSKWQANDPLVHYTVGDLADQGDPLNSWSFNLTQSGLDDLGQPNSRYEPWNNAVRSTNKRFDLGLKDPLITRSDDWDFPTNRMPNVGWLGRVHRGTPWQTVYLKSKLVNTNGSGGWLEWAGSGLRTTNHGQMKFSIVASNSVIDDSFMSMPFQDWAIPDIFSAAIYDNATRGQLSINQTNLAAWSAVLAGVPVRSNLNANAFTNIQPAAVDPALQKIVDGINRTRSRRPGGVFKTLGDICSVPEFTDKSPYLSNAGLPPDHPNYPLNDAVIERIPQQVLGLLRCETVPRFVVYSYGQSLKPANASALSTSDGFNGMCTNYQVTAEVATRAVIRVENAPENPKIVVESFNVLPPE